MFPPDCPVTGQNGSWVLRTINNIGIITLIDHVIIFIDIFIKSIIMRSHTITYTDDTFHVVINGEKFAVRFYEIKD